MAFSFFRHRFLRTMITSLLVIVPVAAHADIPPLFSQPSPVVIPVVRPPINFTADALTHDETGQMVIATGSVEFEDDGRILLADEVRYDLTLETVEAVGNVILTDKNGDVHNAETLQLTGDLRDGYVKALHTTLADGSRFAARDGTRKGGRKIVMNDATYTPCDPCKLDPTKPPVWQLRAKTATHDNVDKTVSYENARLEMWGVPVFYTPYFQHPDGTVTQKSGFLTPTFKLDSQNGTSVGTRYYKAIAPDRDATFGLEAYTQQAPRVLGEYRQRFDAAEMTLRGSTTYSSRKDNRAGQTIDVKDELRGHVQGNGLWDMTDTWRSGFDFNFASDEQYYRQYDVSSDSVLENQIYAERFSGRNYAVGRLLAFQDLRISDRKTDQPDILPDISASFLGDPAEILGGRWSLETSALGLQRSGSGADQMRTSVEGGWQGRYINGPGLLTTVDLSLRGDAYYAMDRPGSGTATDISDTSTKSRLLPIAQVTTSIPFVKPMKTVDLLFEPIAAVTLVTKQNESNKIPNEDSQDIQVDTSNLFEKNRFPGFDRAEDSSRVTYGVRTGLEGHDGSQAEIFLGQSYRFDDNTNGFPDNSGLSTQQSDFVGRLKLAYQDHITLDYGFQLGNETFESVRHELDNGLNFGPFSINTRYLYAKEIAGIGVEGSREQVQSYAAYKFTDDWQGRIGANYDLGENDGLRKGVLGLDYLGQCLTFSATAQRNLTSEATGESNTELFLRIGLKNLGEFQTSGISLAQSSRDGQDEEDIKGLPANPSK
jgi:LPS-assembly protein